MHLRRDQEARVSLGCASSRAALTLISLFKIPACRPELDVRTLSMNQFLDVRVSTQINTDQGYVSPYIYKMKTGFENKETGHTATFSKPT